MEFDIVAFLKVIWVNIILSGDNAVVIALACRGLPEKQRNTGMILGAGVAILLRVVFTLTIVSLLATPYLRIVGAVLLLWVAVKLVTDEGGDSEIAAHDKLFYAVRTIAIADIIMSLDNVLAIAAVAKDNTFMLVLGLVISIPLIIGGAAMIMKLLERFPVLVWAGAALLGWLAGDMVASDPAFIGWVGADMAHKVELPLSAIGAAFVVALAYFLKRKHAAADAA